MKFKFCWDTDCPDWLLAEIANLSNMSSIKLKLLVGHVAKSISGAALDYEKLSKWTGGDEETVAACVGGVRWILEKAAGAKVTSVTLDSELQQLGLPKEHSTAFSKVYSDHESDIYSSLRESKGINCSGGKKEFRVDVKGHEIGGLLEPIVQLSISQFGGKFSNTFCMSSEQLGILIQELTEAKQIMNSLK